MPPNPPEELQKVDSGSSQPTSPQKDDTRLSSSCCSTPTKSAATSTEETPLPKFHVMLTVLVLTIEGLCNSFLLPFVGFLMIHYNPQMSTEQAGLLSGFVVGAFQMAQIPFSRYWGQQSDKNGRRQVVLNGLIFGGISLVGFGFSPTLWLALIARLAQGAANGNAAICKTILADLTDKTNQARAFSFVSVAYASGQLMGPVVGGLLYNPTEQWPSVFAGIEVFKTYPALLPCLAVEAYIIFVGLLVYFYLPETNKKVLRRRAFEAAASAADLSSVSYGATDDSVVLSPVSPTSPTSPTEGAESKQPFGLRQLFRYEEDPVHPEYGPQDLSALRRLILGYMLCCAIEIVFMEIAPLLMILPKRDGGFAWESKDIGLFFTLQGAYGFIASQLMPLFINTFGRIRSLQGGVGVAAVCSVVFPLIAYAPEPFPGFVFLLLFVVVQRTALNTCFSAAMMSVPLKAPSSHLGAVNGIAHSAGNLSRGLCPMVAAPIFAWSVSTQHKFPLNQFFVFLCNATVGFLGLLELRKLHANAV